MTRRYQKLFGIAPTLVRLTCMLIAFAVPAQVGWCAEGRFLVSYGGHCRLSASALGQ